MISRTILYVGEYILFVDR